MNLKSIITECNFVILSSMMWIIFTLTHILIAMALCGSIYTKRHFKLCIAPWFIENTIIICKIDYI